MNFGAKIQKYKICIRLIKTDIKKIFLNIVLHKITKNALKKF